MHALLTQLMDDGVADLGVVWQDESPANVADDIARAICGARFGEIEVLRPVDENVRGANTYSGNYGRNSFPLHTDLAHWHRPPRYVMLRCVEGAPSVSTRVVDRRSLSPYFKEHELRRALFTPRRPIEGRRCLLSALAGEVFRWDPLFLLPKNKLAEALVSALPELCNELPAKEFLLNESGHTLLLDNWRVMHGRSRVPASEASRVIARAYLS